MKTIQLTQKQFDCVMSAFSVNAMIKGGISIKDNIESVQIMNSKGRLTIGFVVKGGKNE